MSDCIPNYVNIILIRYYFIIDNKYWIMNRNIILYSELNCCIIAQTILYIYIDIFHDY